MSRTSQTRKEYRNIARGCSSHGSKAKPPIHRRRLYELPNSMFTAKITQQQRLQANCYQQARLENIHAPQTRIETSPLPEFFGYATEI